VHKPEFDAYAESYDRVLEAAIPDGLNESGYFAEYKVALMAERLKDTVPQRVLDFGCGAGRGLPFLQQYLPHAQIWGYDPSPASLRMAAVRAPNAKLVSEWDEARDAKFDAIIAANVFHHIKPAERVAELIRCRDALAPGGRMFLFEHNPHNPLTRYVFERCPFDADAEMFDLGTARKMASQAGFRNESHGYTLFFPRPLAFMRRLEKGMRWIPLGAQYYVDMAP
jgi:SAM-dependent methyltransferase